MKTITHKGITYTVIAEAETNTSKLIITLDNGLITKWVSHPQDGDLIPVAFGPVDSHRVWDETITKEAALHGGAWWEDHKAQLMAMTWVALQS